MPKMKSVKGATKRFKVKKNGQIKRGKAFRSHILTKQDAGTRRDQNSPAACCREAQTALVRPAQRRGAGGAEAEEQ